MNTAWVGCHYPDTDHVFTAGVNGAWIYAAHPHAHTLSTLRQSGDREAHVRSFKHTEMFVGLFRWNTDEAPCRLHLTRVAAAQSVICHVSQQSHSKIHNPMIPESASDPLYGGIHHVV